MKKSKLWLAALLAPFLLTSSLSADEPAAPKSEKTAEAKKPSLTFYYYPG